jgi:inhibitor of cysteine peptidase
MTFDGPTSRARASGGLVEIKLPESPTTGYRWELENEHSAVSILETRYEQDPSQGRVGGGGVRTFILRIARPLPTELSFVLRRQWETEPVERRLVEVVVDD